MRAIQLQQLVKGPDDLRVVDLPDLQSHPTKYLIRIRAIATNFFDNLQIQGKHQQKPPLPFIAGNEFAGEVIATSTAAEHTRETLWFKVGDRVFGAGLGAYATLINNDEADLRPIPSDWTYSGASSLFYTAPTAYAALKLRVHAEEDMSKRLNAIFSSFPRGDYILIHGAGGGVGLAAVNIARALGMYVIASADTEKKRQIAKEFGAHYVVDATGDWAEEARNCTPDKRGVDVVLDPLGVISQSLKCIRWNGRLVVIGFAAGQIEKIPTNRLLLKNSLRPILGMYATVEPETVTRVWETLMDIIAKGGIKPFVYTEREFKGLEDIPAALKLLASGTAWGKIVVDLGEGQENKSKL